MLKRACRNIYVNAFAEIESSSIIEYIALALRRGEYNYASLETMLSEYGLISQILTSRITVITTGRKGVFHTPYGTIEFTHTKRSVHEILQSTLVTDRPLRIATKDAALRDLKRVGRNLALIDLKEL